VSGTTSFSIDQVAFTAAEIELLTHQDPRFSNWPVVYTLDDQSSIYVGESRAVTGRMRQHLDVSDKKELQRVHVVLDETFNKSVCLDLESHLNRWLAGDGTFNVLNRNEGITNADYYRRSTYQAAFVDIFEALKERGLFAGSIEDIENSDLFKLSPFKALTGDQETAVVAILNGLFDDLANARSSRTVIQGDPGTGKTVVGVFLMKLLTDIQNANSDEPVDTDSAFADFFLHDDERAWLEGFRMGLVVPQQSLRGSVRKVFQKTPGLGKSMVLTPFQVGESTERFDLLIVDETHRLTHRANQPSGVSNKKFRQINERLFGGDDLALTQLDWIVKQSDHQIFLVDAAQSVRPADLPAASVGGLIGLAKELDRHFVLTSQMRVQAGADFVGYVRRMLSSNPPVPRTFKGYDLRLFDDFADMRAQIVARESESGLARLVAGYAWPWNSRNDVEAYDIELDGEELRWNTSPVDWVNSTGSIDEMGSIHTIQGYDLNYAGVVIGHDLRFDPEQRKLYFDRANYFDRKGKENNQALGLEYSDEDLLRFVLNIYAVLLTRGVRGTYIYACDRALREYLRQFVQRG